MAENDLVGNQNPAGADGDQPSVSGGTGQPIASPAAESQGFVSKKDFELVVKELRGLQGRQDKSQTEQTRFMDEMRTHMAKGLSFDEAEKAVNESNKAREKDDLLYKMAEKLGVSATSSQSAPAGNGNPVTVDAARVLSEFSLDGNDPEVVAQVLSKSTEVEQVRAAASLALRRANSTTPSPAAATALAGKPAAPANAAELTNNYIKDMKAARGKPSDLDAIKKKYMGLGVNIHEVVFS